MDRFEDAFVREAKSAIRALSDGLLALERDGDASVDELFREAHSLKGTCRTQGLPEAGELAHALEDVLDALRSDEVEPATALIDESLEVVDCLEAVVRAYADGDEPERDVDASLASLRSTLDERRAQPSDDPPAGEPSPEPTRDDEWDPADSELSDDVVAALEATTEFDDLDALVEDGDESGDDLDGWGLLDDDAAGDDDDSEETPSHGESGGTPPDAETPDDPAAFFEETKSDLEATDGVDSLQADIDAVEFGEFDEDDNYTIDELMALDPDESTPEAGDAGVGEGVQTEDVETGGVERETEGVIDRAKEETPETDAVEEVPESEVVEDDHAENHEVVEEDPAESHEIDEEAPIEGQVVSSDDEDATNEFVFGSPADDTDHESDPDEQANEDGETERRAAETDRTPADVSDPGSLPDSDSESRPDSDPLQDSVPDPESVPDLDAVPDPDSVPDPESVPDADIDVELSGDFDVGSEDELTDDSQLDVAVDEEMEAFESRFGDLLGGGPDAEAARDGPTFRAAVSTIEESRLDADEFPTAAATRDPGGGSEFDRIQEMTVDVDTADRLLNVAEELSLTHLRLDEAVGPETDEAISEEVSNLRRVVTEYRRTVMDVRLVPLRTAVEPVPRTVRDVARSQNKEVELVVEDADVELDRGIVDELRDPLVHLARNAVDHGIEPTDDRVAADKPAEGTVEIRAERVGDSVVIEISDDGRGIDPEAVRQRAVDTGALTPKEARRLDDEDAYDLLFEPGFTTREEVTDVSGRGVGMDVVNRSVAELDGSVTVESVPGEGTTVRLTVPVSIVFTEVLFVEANRETFGVPMSVVEQITATPQVRTDDGREVVSRSDIDAIGGLPDDGMADPADVNGVEADGKTEVEAADDGAADSYPLIRLASALDLQERPDADEEGETSSTEGQVVWVRAEDELLALRCDRVVTSREVVVRPYGDLLRDVPGVGGATTLGDGEAVNVLDVGSI